MEERICGKDEFSARVEERKSNGWW